VVVIVEVTIVPPRGVHRCSSHRAADGRACGPARPASDQREAHWTGDRERLAPQSAPAIRSSNECSGRRPASGVSNGAAGSCMLARSSALRSSRSTRRSGS